MESNHALMGLAALAQETRLAIVRRLVREADGAIHLRSTPGEGARFTVFLQTYP